MQPAYGWSLGADGGKSAIQSKSWGSRVNLRPLEARGSRVHLRQLETRGSRVYLRPLEGGYAAEGLDAWNPMIGGASSHKAAEVSVGRGGAHAWIKSRIKLYTMYERIALRRGTEQTDEMTYVRSSVESSVVLLHLKTTHNSYISGQCWTKCDISFWTEQLRMLTKQDKSYPFQQHLTKSNSLFRRLQ